MFTIKEFEEKKTKSQSNVIDLNGLKEYSDNFEVLSFTENGKRIPFHVDLVSNPNISISAFGVNSINITIDVEAIVNDEFIVLKNAYEEELRIDIKPNEYFVNDRDYKFKITKSELLENGDLKLKILSKVNNEEMGWRCTYFGQPIEYTVTPMESDKSCYVTITPISHLLIDYETLFKFQQEESGEEITYIVKITPNGIVIS